jgi:hypothetical protein
VIPVSRSSQLDLPIGTRTPKIKYGPVLPGWRRRASRTPLLFAVGAVISYSARFLPPGSLGPPPPQVGRARFFSGRREFIP